MADLVKTVPVILFSFFMLFTLKELFQSQSNAEISNKDIPYTNLGATKYVGPTLKILYCYSCGYRNAFDQYSDMLHKKYPEIVVEGGNFPPPGYNAILARVLTITKFLAILLIISGFDVCRYLGQNVVPSWWSWCLNNKVYSSMMIFLLCNMLEGHLVSTGAFEISFNDVPVWSKLETGRIPELQELFQIIDSQMKFQDKSFQVNLENM